MVTKVNQQIPLTFALNLKYLAETEAVRKTHIPRGGSPQAQGWARKGSGPQHLTTTTWQLGLRQNGERHPLPASNQGNSGLNEGHQSSGLVTC